MVCCSSFYCSSCCFSHCCPDFHHHSHGLHGCSHHSHCGRGCHYWLGPCCGSGCCFPSQASAQRSHLRSMEYYHRTLSDSYRTRADHIARHFSI